MNSSYERVVLWGELRLEQVEERKDELVRYETMWGTVTLYRSKSNQWIAQFELGAYSVEDSWDEALLSAAKKAIVSHQYSICKIEASIEAEYGASSVEY